MTDELMKSYVPQIVYYDGADAGNPYWEFIAKDVPVLSCISSGGQFFAGEVLRDVGPSREVIGLRVYSATPAQTKGDDLVEMLDADRVVDLNWPDECLTAIQREYDLCARAASRIQSLTASNEALIKGVCFEGVAKRKLDDLTSPERGWEVCGYAIRKGDEYGLVTTGAFVGWFSVTERNDADARRQLQAAQAEIARVREALEGLNVTEQELVRIHNMCTGVDGDVKIWSTMLHKLTVFAITARTALTPQEPT